MTKIEQAIQLLREYLAENQKTPVDVPDVTIPTGAPLIWGSKVSPVFRDRVRWIAEDLGFDPNWLMACMAFESGETFRADIKNGAGSGATGLIQFMPRTAVGLETTTEALAKMTPEDQLNYVWKYFKPYDGRIKSVDDMYMAILWPAGVGKAANYVIFRGPDATSYRQNRGLDTNKDGNVTKAECVAKIKEKMVRGEQFRG